MSKRSLYLSIALFALLLYHFLGAETAGAGAVIAVATSATRERRRRAEERQEHYARLARAEEMRANELKNDARARGERRASEWLDSDF